MMTALVEERIDDPVSIVDGYITIYLPQFSLKIVQAVKQVKGMGTHDAKRLAGHRPDLEHLAIIEMMLSPQERTDLTAEEMRVKTRTLLYFKDDILFRKFDKQSWFQRKHSELLYWKIIERVGQRAAPTYEINREKALILKNGGVFA